ncbi:EF-hand calcium-binding domain-containing protein 11 [Andrena cerasifolii]|uniref:EF-hand calcium-binding domain-containing protein 11 n=1 Tax=Andrena cerasifolii TaxID=2819439 RepID=UPI00403794FF
MTAVFGYCPDKVEVKLVFRSADRISYEQFEHWVYKKCCSNDSRVNAEMLFTLLDKDYKGYLVLEDFCSASKSVDLKLPSSVWQTVFKELDHYKKGYIDFDEFTSILSVV